MQLSVMEKFIKGGEGIEKLLKVRIGARTRIVDDKIRCGKGRTAGISGYNHPMLGTGGSFCSDEHGFSFFEHAVNTAEISFVPVVHFIIIRPKNISARIITELFGHGVRINGTSASERFHHRNAGGDTADFADGFARRTDFYRGPAFVCLFIVRHIKGYGRIVRSVFGKIRGTYTSDFVSVIKHPCPVSVGRKDYQIFAF